MPHIVRGTRRGSGVALDGVSLGGGILDGGILDKKDVDWVVCTGIACREGLVICFHCSVIL